MSTQITNERLRGCLLEAAPSPAPKLVLSGSGGGIPPAMDLRPYCSAVEHQGNLNSCAANSVVGAMEYLRNRMNLPPIELSRLFVYYTGQTVVGAVARLANLVARCCRRCAPESCSRCRG